jgi:hypothetical protein
MLRQPIAIPVKLNQKPKLHHITISTLCNAGPETGARMPRSFASMKSPIGSSVAESEVAPTLNPNASQAKFFVGQAVRASCDSRCRV